MTAHDVADLPVRALLAALPDAVVTVAPDGRIATANPAAVRMFGYVASELSGVPLASLLSYPPDQVADLLECLLTGSPPYRVDGLVGRGREGRTFTADLAVGAIDVGGVRTTVLSIREVPARPTVETSAAAADPHDRDPSGSAPFASEAMFRGLVEAVADAIVVVDNETRITLVNRAAERLFGWPRELIVGQPIETLVPLACRGRHAVHVTEFMADPQARPMGLHAADMKGRRRDGTEFPVDVALSPMPSPSGQLVTAAIRDLTEKRRLEAQQAEEHERMTSQVMAAQRMEAIGRLAGGIAHDFNNVLAVIMSYAEFLRDEAIRAGDPADSDIEQILLAAANGARLTDQLLAFSRQQVRAVKVVDLNEVVAAVERLLARLIGEDVELVTRRRPGLATIRADVTQMEQVLMNLAVNARDAMPSGGRLTIETSNAQLDADYGITKGVQVPPGPYVLLTVADTGVGMTGEVQARIFEPFFTTKERGKGTGLGLSTVYGIVKQSDGFLWVDSEAGKGTTFRIYLPAADAERPTEPARRSSIPPTLLGTETVLLVEDEDAVRRAAARILRRNGYSVIEAAGGAEALALAEQHDGPIHLLLTDVVMPYLSGRDLAERIGPARPDMRVLFMSGYTDDAVVRMGVLQDATAFLPKPFGQEALLRRIREVLDAAK